MSPVVLVSDLSKTSKTLPKSFILPPNERPEDAEISYDIPVIDLSLARGGEEGKLKLLEDIIRASQDYGLFQVINHEVPEKLMDDAMRLGKEYFDLPAEEKMKPYGPDHQSGERTLQWRDVLQHLCHPVQDYIESWPDKPTTYREVIAAYSVKVREMTLKILDLMSEGLGLELGYFDGELSNNQVLNINHYPPCPDPTLTVGVGAHCDPNLLTINQQEVYGFQILKDGKWIGVKPLPHAFVITLSSQLEVISNGKLKAARHRVVTNSEVSRMSIINFFFPSLECIIQPAKKLDPPKFKTFKFKDFFENYLNKSKKPVTGSPDNDLMEQIELFKL